MKKNRNKKILIIVSSTIVTLILIALFLFHKISNLGITHVSYSYSIGESKRLGVFINQFNTTYNSSLNDSLTKYDIKGSLDSLECWLEYGFKYKPLFFYYSVSKLEYFRLNFPNPFKTDSLNDNQFLIGTKGTDCKSIALFQNFVSIKLENFSDTIICDTYVSINGNKDSCRYIGDIYMIKNNH